MQKLLKIMTLLPLVMIQSTPASSEVQEPFWYAFGELRGYIEPCGCDPRTDLGGVRRISNQVSKIRSVHKDLLLFDLGNNLEPTKPKSLRSNYINKAIDFIKPDVSLFNVIELRNKSKLGNRPYVLSNLLKKVKGVSHSITKKTVIIYGYVETKNQKLLLQQLDKELLGKWSRELLKIKKTKILLFSGSDKSLKIIHEKKIFDVVISSNKLKFSSIIDNTERDNPGILLRSESPATYMVPVGGQGLLRGGSFPEEVKLTIGIDNNSKQTKIDLFKEGETPFANLKSIVDWLPKELEQNSPIKNLMAEFEIKLAAEYDQNSKSKIENLKNTEYAGALRCKSCHIKEWIIWNKTDHSSALETLEKKSKAKDEHCVKCHVAGFNKGGFISKKDTPEFKGVQCENCHGPLKKHVMNPSIKPDKAKQEACVQCHVSPHSSSFNYEKYWQKIKH